MGSLLKVNQSWHPRLHRPTTGRQRSSTYALMGVDSEIFGQNSVKIGRRLGSQWSFVGGSRVVRPTLSRYPTHRKGFILSASYFVDLSQSEQVRTQDGITTSQIANSVFTLGTVAVLPFYTLMVLAPNAQLVFHDGLENKVETRHSVSLCLLFCPIGIVSHSITKALNRRTADDTE
ncbi:hypothetical protein QJS04_geneDACA017667 [Acorus gramineus]|uniref:Uncharacterized protein n=1 Tax=Acorus gramineus TaxID=55184 RepID=A0AAV9AV69_ACOGR|nr:hypothetical protein QJS04_geneDACA017667 [Acorus gramineus]